jgi:hypothetical protein
MHNIIVPINHQAAPSLHYDDLLAREAAAAEDPLKAAGVDWELEKWQAEHPDIARRRRMVNQDFDREFDSADHHDPDLGMLKQHAHLQAVQRRPNGWVEENLELYETNCERARGQRLPGQERWEGKEQQEARMVNILHPHGVLRKLRAAGIEARTDESPYARIWLNEWSAAGLVGVNAWVKPQEMDDEGYLLELSTAKTQAAKDYLTANYAACRSGRKVRKTITCLQDGYAPEWSIMRFDHHGVATKEKFRGWRTAMLVLIVSEVLTEEEVDRAFGPPIGEAGAWYRSQLQSWRQLKLGKAI